jgi:small-conductance mechanosensitive channel
MKTFKYLLAAVLAILLAAALIAFYATRDTGKLDVARKNAGEESLAEASLVDTSMLRAELALAPQAATAEEQAQAHEAWQLADHELDLTYAAALRDAQAAASVPVTGPLRQLSDRVATLTDRVEADKKRVDALGKTAGDALDLAQAQLDLDQDELDDAKQDLAREGGDKRARLQRLLQEHEESDKVADQAVKFNALSPTETMKDQVVSWLGLGDYQERLTAATLQARAHADALLKQHGELEQKLPKRSDSDASVTGLRQRSAQQKMLTGFDERLQDTKQLAGVYQSWNALVEARRLLNALIPHVFRGTDRHRLHQLHVIARITLQILALFLILLVVFGPPTQLSTLIGLVTAGFTVVMKDFIVAFFGWFTLMGKNGISIGDWVEIEGVSGEVIEIGLLKTVLLELGNWTETGHPTGRQVSFSNSFATEGHYFNFSTSNQWLWDEMQFALPSTGDPYQMAEQVRQIVERETKEYATEAADDWQRVTQQYGAREFSAGPAVNLRPGAAGLELMVRYITRAPQRNIVKAKLFQAVVDLLHKPA